MRMREEYKPFSLHLGIANSTTTINSITGNKMATGIAANPKIGESANCSLNTS